MKKHEVPQSAHKTGTKTTTTTTAATAQHTLNKDNHITRTFAAVMEQIRQILFGATTTTTRRKKRRRSNGNGSFVVTSFFYNNGKGKSKFKHRLPKTSISNALQYAKAHTKQAQCSERTYIIADFFQERIRSKRTDEDNDKNEEIDNDFDSSAILSSTRTTTFGGYDQFGDHMCLEFRVKKTTTRKKEGFASLTIHFTRTLVGGWELSGSGSSSINSVSNDATSGQKDVTATTSIEEGFAAKDGTAYWYQTTEDDDGALIQPTVVFGTFVYDETISSFVFHGEYQSLPLKKNFGKVELIATTMVVSKDDGTRYEEDASSSSSSSSSVGTSQTSLTPSEEEEDDDDISHIDDEDHDCYHDDEGNHGNVSTTTATATSTTDRIEKHVRFQSKEEMYYVERYLIPESEEEEDENIPKKKQQPKKKSKKDRKSKKEKKSSEVAQASKKKKHKKKSRDGGEETTTPTDSSMKSSSSDLKVTTIKKKKTTATSKKKEKTIQKKEGKKKSKKTKKTCSSSNNET